MICYKILHSLLCLYKIIIFPCILIHTKYIPENFNDARFITYNTTQLIMKLQKTEKSVNLKYSNCM